MKNLEKIASDYLLKQTDFAIQIVGSWGYGKTYYYRNTLEDLIYATPTYTDASKNYKPIYISLFGLKSVEDIATKIVLDFYQSKLFKTYLKKTEVKKRLKITQSILKIGLRGFLNFQQLGSPNEYLTDIKTIGENVLDTSELVICFDDLERKDSSLNIEDLTGYINSLVDEGIKVLIISNEDLLLKSGDQYKNIKEKIIGITVEFVPNVAETLKNIIKRRYSTFPVFTSYLNENIDLLINLSETIDNNFRHLTYALDSLHDCYSQIRNQIIDGNNEIKEKVNEELKNIFVFTIALAVEYKSSRLKYGDKSDYEASNIFLEDLFADNTMADSSKNDTTETKLNTLLSSYKIPREQYHFYESIFNYVTGHDEFSIDNFIVEFKKIFHLEKGNILPQYTVLNSLNYPNCFSLDDKAYQEQTLKLIEYASEGRYSPVEYLSIMHYVERFDNILNLNLEDVKNKLLAGLITVIKIGAFPDHSYSQFDMSGRMSEISAINKQLYKEGMAAIKQEKRNKIKQKILNAVDLLTSDIQEFQRRYETEQDFRLHLDHYGFLNNVEPSTLLEKIKVADNHTLFFLQQFFRDRYRDRAKLIQEFESLKNITDLLIQYNSELSATQTQKIKAYVVNQLTNTLISFRDSAEKLQVEFRNSPTDFGEND
jgi:hypothetical protein